MQDIDKGYAALMQRMRTWRTPRSVDAGIPEDKAAVPHGEGPETVGEVALANEFGTDTIPERSFLRSAFDENLPANVALLRKQFERVVQGEIDEPYALALVGMKMVNDIRAKIESHVPPPNAEATVKKKGFDHPLVETRQMIDAVGYKVR